MCKVKKKHFHLSVEGDIFSWHTRISMGLYSKVIRYFYGLEPFMVQTCNTMSLLKSFSYKIILNLAIKSIKFNFFAESYYAVEFPAEYVTLGRGNCQQFIA